MDQKISDLQASLNQEHENTQKVIEEVKYQHELVQKFGQDQNKAEKDNLREKYSELDGLIKSEITRRGEALNNMEQGLESQIKALQSQIRKEEIGRAQQELILKSDITKLAEQLRTDYEQFKLQQNQLTEKITEMIKLEVDSRLFSEKDAKSFTEAMFKKIIEEMNAFKEAVEKQNKRFARDMKESNNENAERAGFLSRYIDDQIKKQEEEFLLQLQKVKLLCAKLTEQVKEHLQNNEIIMIQLKNSLGKRCDDIEDELSALGKQVDSEIYDFSAKSAMNKIYSEVEHNNLYSILNNLNVLYVDEISQRKNSISEILKKIIETKENMQKREEETKEKLHEEIERKNMSTLEKLKKENEENWNTSMKLVEKQFSREGVKEIIELVPPVVMDLKKGKESLVILANEKHETPKPQIMLPDSFREKSPAKPEEKKKVDTTDKNIEEIKKEDHKEEIKKEDHKAEIKKEDHKAEIKKEDD